MSLIHKMSDQELFFLLKDGDTSAFTEIHTRYYPILYRHACVKLNDREEVKDLLQELFSFIWNDREALNVQTNPSGYLYAAIRNRILNIYKFNKVRTDHLVSLQSYLLREPVAESDESLRVKQLQEIIEAEVAKLPSQMRLIFEMSRVKNLSHQEIASELGISVHTVRKQVQNTLKVLRVKLGVLFIFLIF